VNVTLLSCRFISGEKFCTNYCGIAISYYSGVINFTVCCFFRNDEALFVMPLFRLEVRITAAYCFIYG
jgi:hypothetical protein